MTTAVDWAGMPALVDLLSSRPSPADALRGFIDGPGAHLGMPAGVLVRARGSEVLVLARHGHASATLAPTDLMTRTDTWPVCRAVAQAETIADDPSHLATPIISRGRAVGGLALARPSGQPLTSADIAVLEGAGAAVGLWLTHPDAGAQPETPERPAPDLTARQLAILRMVAEGRTNAAIGTALGYSPSTIKQELRRLGRALDAGDRRTLVERALRLGLVGPGPA